MQSTLAGLPGAAGQSLALSGKRWPSPGAASIGETAVEPFTRAPPISTRSCPCPSCTQATRRLTSPGGASPCAWCAVRDARASARARGAPEASCGRPGCTGPAAPPACLVPPSGVAHPTRAAAGPCLSLCRRTRGAWSRWPSRLSARSAACSSRTGCAPPLSSFFLWSPLRAAPPCRPQRFPAGRTVAGRAAGGAVLAHFPLSYRPTDWPAGARPPAPAPARPPTGGDGGGVPRAPTRPGQRHLGGGQRDRGPAVEGHAGGQPRGGTRQGS
jgi:hypothetical protein